MTASSRGTLVFDESGDTGTLTIPESYSTVGIYCANERDMDVVTALDTDLRNATGLRDYKDKNVRENDAARAHVAAAFRKHSTVFVAAIASISGGIATEELRFDEAVRGTASASEQASGPPRTRRENLDYFTVGVAQASIGISHSQMQSIDVWWDRRSDMQAIEDAFALASGVSVRLNEADADIPIVRRTAEANQRGVTVEFRGACDHRTRAASRVAGIIAADLLRVAEASLPSITPLLRENEVLNRLPRAREQYFNNGGIRVGDCAEPFDRDSYRLHKMPLFRAYANRLAAGHFSLWEPGGRICHVARLHGRWHVLQVPD